MKGTVVLALLLAASISTGTCWLITFENTGIEFCFVELYRHASRWKAQEGSTGAQYQDDFMIFQAQ